GYDSSENIRSVRKRGLATNQQTERPRDVGAGRSHIAPCRLLWRSAGLLRRSSQSQKRAVRPLHILIPQKSRRAPVSPAVVARRSVDRKSVAARHPVGQQVIDSGAFDQAASVPAELEGAALPQKVRCDAILDGYWAAGLVRSSAGSVHRAEIHGKIAARTGEQGCEERAYFHILTGLLSFDCRMNHREKRILMGARRFPEDPVSRAIEPGAVSFRFPVHQMVEIDRSEIVLVIR